MPTSPTLTYALGTDRVDPIFAPFPTKVMRVALKAPGSGVTNLAAGTILGEVTATPGTYAPYATGNVDGTQNPIGVLQYACSVDTLGDITFTSTTGQVGGEWGQFQNGAPMWYGGEFRTQELVGLDAGAVTKLGRLVEGSITTGILHIS